MNARAIELQFHWIFVLIAGAIILAFFFNVVQKQRSLSEQKLSITLAGQMDAIYAGAIESKGSVQPLVTPKPGIAFSCSEACECNYVIGKKATEFRDKLLFAPSLIAGQDALGWSMEWKLPFRIANFLLLTNPSIAYYLVYEQGNPASEQLYRRLGKDLPRELNAEVLRSPSDVLGLLPQGYARTRLVFLGVQPPDLRNLNLAFASEDVSAVAIDPGLRQAVFWEKTSPDELEFSQRKSMLAGDATAYAAVFAADHKMYDCVMRRAFGKMRVVALVQAGRAQKLQEQMGALQRPECAYVLQDLDAVSQAAGQLAAEGSLRNREDALATILGMQSELQRQNNQLILQSCPELY